VNQTGFYFTKHFLLAKKYLHGLYEELKKGIMDAYLRILEKLRNYAFLCPYDVHD
jgi:hypothetical protein